MPRECVPENDLEGAPRALDLVPDHGGAALALRLRRRIAAGEDERAARDERGLVDELGLGAERDPREAATAVARRFPHEHHAGAAASRFEVRLEILQSLARPGLARRAVAVVRIPPGIEDARAVGGSFLEEREEARGILHCARF